MWAREAHLVSVIVPQAMIQRSSGSVLLILLEKTAALQAAERTCVCAEYERFCHFSTRSFILGEGRDKIATFRDSVMNSACAGVCNIDNGRTGARCIAGALRATVHCGRSVTYGRRFRTGGRAAVIKRLSLCRMYAADAMRALHANEVRPLAGAYV